jgi:hypothetical protein
LEQRDGEGTGRKSDNQNWFNLSNSFLDTKFVTAGWSTDEARFVFGYMWWCNVLLLGNWLIVTSISIITLMLLYLCLFRFSSLVHISCVLDLGCLSHICWFSVSYYD